MLTAHTLPRAAPATVLACGAWLKNTACLLQGRQLWCSPLHGDLGTVDARGALQHSLQALLGQAGGRVQAVAHDTHPDFHSTHLARELAARLGVPALAVQHHAAHLAAVQAHAGLAGPLLGLALDGVGHGTDGTAWGGELLLLDEAQARWQRLAHLAPLALPGGDTAAREPWRMAAAALHTLGRGGEIPARFGPAVGAVLAQGVQQMLRRQLNSPLTTAAGRWFDAAAGALGLCLRQKAEAEAALALQASAQAWLAQHPAPVVDAELQAAGLDLRALLARLFALADAGRVAEGAALFHEALADALARATQQAAAQHGVAQVALGGGCFFNPLLRAGLTRRLAAAGLAAHLPAGLNPGDAGLALGQAWWAAHTVHIAKTQEAACA